MSPRWQHQHRAQLAAGSRMLRGAVTESRCALACRHFSAVATGCDLESSLKGRASAFEPNRWPQSKEQIAEKVQVEIEPPRRTLLLRTSNSGHLRTARAIARGREPWIR